MTFGLATRKLYPKVVRRHGEGAKAQLYVAHHGPSIELAQSVGLLVLFLGLLLVTERQTTGRWCRWSRR
ncbi:hypothetical protein ACFW1F_18345 [Streptomyces bungoensis]|uniref:hypothetical protein n=1 Tax=Streptomyces bungoensis TaxID=285568 RepID=UPI00343F6A82